MKMFTTSRAKKIMAVALSAVISMTFSSSDVTGLGSVLAAEDELQYYDKSKSIKIDLDDNGEELGSIWFDGEKYYDHNPDDEIGIEYPSGEWNVTKEIEGTDYTITAKIPAGAFDRRVGFYANIITKDELTEVQKDVLQQNELSIDKLEYFDIGFKDSKGDEIEPSKSIALSIRMKNRATKVKENGDSLIIDVYHVKEAGEPSLDKVASIDEKFTKTDDENSEDTKGDSNGITVEDGDVVASFQTDSLSLFVLNDGSGNPTIIFDKNAAQYGVTDADITGTMEDQSFAPDFAGFLTANAFTWTDHVFVDWCTVPDPANPGDNAVVRYSDGHYITLEDEDVTLYAQWAEGVTVTYRYDADKDGVYEDIASEMKKQIVGKGTETPMMHTGFTNGSMALIKWNTDPDLVSGDTYEVTGKIPTITVDADTTLYAVWESGWNKMGNQSTSTVLWKVQGGNTIRVRPMDGVEGSFVGTGNATWIGLDAGSRGAITKVSNEGLIYASGDFYNHFVYFNMSELDLSNFIVTYAQDLRGFLQYLTKLTVADITTVTTNSATLGYHMFDVSTGVKKIIIGTGWNKGDGQAIFPTTMYRIEDGMRFPANSTIPSYVDSIATTDENGKKSNTFTVGKIITYKANGGEGDDYKQVVAFDQTGENAASAYNNLNRDRTKHFTKDGDEVIGWNTNADGTGTFYDVNQVKAFDYSSVVDGTVLYAIWAHKHDLYGGQDGDLIEFEKWGENDKLPNVAGDYFLSKDVTLSSAWSAPNGTTRLCLNGHKVTKSSITVPVGATLIITDCNGHRHDPYIVKSPVDNKDKSITTGLITGGSSGIQVNGTFSMYGGTIAGVSSSSDGAGVFVQNNGTMNFYGGSIVHCSARNGGGIGVKNGTLNMEGGEVKYCKANDGGYLYCHGGGGVHIYQSTFTMNGGIIANNTAAQTGGGVIVAYKSHFIMNGGKLADNICNGYSGGAVWFGDDTASGVEENKSYFTMTGGEITGNSAYTYGGGICLTRQTEAHISGGLFENNTARNLRSGKGGGAIQADGQVKLYMSGEPKIETNYSSGSINNVFLNNTDFRLIAEGEFGKNASIGITMPTPGDFTTGYGYSTSGADNYRKFPGKFFFSDDKAYAVDIADDNKEATLLPAHIHNLPCEGTDDQISFRRWRRSDSLPSAADFDDDTEVSWYLNQDVVLSSTWTVPAGKTINLCLNGHKITSNNALGDMIICDNANSVFNITDCNEKTVNSFISASTGQQETVIGGIITGATRHAITVSAGKASLYRGNIAGIKNTIANATDGRGAAVFVKTSGEFYMYGGRIAHNYIYEHGGAGIAARDSSKLFLKGGRLDHNTASYGGAIIITETAEFYMSGGLLDYNVATNATNYSPLPEGGAGGGAICIGATHNRVGVIEITGGEISNNFAEIQGGGIGADKRNPGNKTSIKISNVVIKNNEAKVRGGGVAISPGDASLEMKGKPYIYNNHISNSSAQNNVFLYTGRLIKVTGAFEDGASVGITMLNPPGVFTTDYGYTGGHNDDKDPARYFSSDNQQYEVLVHENKEARLGVANHKHNHYGVHSDDEITFKRWPYDDRLPSDADITEQNNKFYLAYDVTLTDTWTCKKNVTICLNGHQIVKSSGDVIRASAGTLTICDDKLYETDPVKRQHKVNDRFKGSDLATIEGGLIGGTNNGIGIAVTGKLNFYGGTVAGVNGTSGIRISSSGQADIYGGTISYNRFGSNAGGGISAVNNAKLTLHSDDVHSGCDIHHNWATGGGGIHVTNNTIFVMDGGKIHENYASTVQNDSGGGGVNFGTSFMGSAVFSKGSIYNNEAAGFGGGIRVGSGNNIKLSGTHIYDNKAGHGGGLAIIDHSATAIKGKVIFDKGLIGVDGSNEELKGNTALLGAGIYIEEGTTLTLKDNEDGSAPIITGNIAEEQAGGLYICKNAELRMSGNLIVKDNYVVPNNSDVKKFSNIWLPTDDGTSADKKYNIIIEGKLNKPEGEDARIGVTKEPMENSVTTRFTTGYGYSKSSVQNEDGTNSTEYHYKSEGGGIDPADYFFADAHENYLKDHALSPNGDVMVMPYTDKVEAMLTPGYIIEYHSPIDAPVANAGFVTDDTASRAKWNDHYQEESGHEDSPYSKVDQTSPVETYFEEIAVEEPATGSEPAKVPKATEPKDPTWNPKTGYVFSGWVIVNTDGTADVQTTTEYSFGKEIKKSLKLNATWEQVPADDKGSYVGGLVGYAEDNITFTDCNVAATSSTGLLLRSESYSGYAGGYLGYGMKAVAASGTGQTNVRLYGSILGGLCGSQEPTGTDTYSSFSVSGVTTNGYVIAHPNDPKSAGNASFIPYRLVAGEYIGRPLAESESVPTHSQTQSVSSAEFKFYDASIMTGGPGTSTSITSVVRPNHRYYQPKLPTSGDQTERDVDPLKDVDTATPYGSEGD